MEDAGSFILSICRLNNVCLKIIVNWKKNLLEISERRWDGKKAVNNSRELQVSNNEDVSCFLLRS
jgi:hypothetical protein